MKGTVVDFYKDWENSFEHKRGDDAARRAHINAVNRPAGEPESDRIRHLVS